MMPSASPPPYRTRLMGLPDPEAVAAWAALRAASPESSPYDAPAYVEAVAHAFGLTPRLALVQETQEPRAGCVLYERRRGPLTELVIPRFTPYTPLLTGPGWSTAETHRRRSPLDALLALIEQTYPVARLHLTPDVPDVRTFSWRGWQVRPLYTYHVPLDRPEPPAAYFPKNNRRDIRNQQPNFEICESPDQIPSVITLAAASYDRHDRALPAPESTMVPLVRTLAAAGLARAFTATPRDAPDPEAGVILLQDGPTAFYWLAGSVRGFAMTVLVGHLLETLHREGAARLDFVGANTPSIAEFKRRFGSVLVPYYRATRASGVLPRLLSTVGLLR